MKQLGENDPVLIKALEDIVQTSLSEALQQKPVYTLVRYCRTKPR